MFSFYSFYFSNLCCNLKWLNDIMQHFLWNFYYLAICIIYVVPDRIELSSLVLQTSVLTTATTVPYLLSIYRSMGGIWTLKLYLERVVTLPFCLPYHNFWWWYRKERICWLKTYTTIIFFVHCCTRQNRTDIKWLWFIRLIH